MSKAVFRYFNRIFLYVHLLVVNGQLRTFVLEIDTGSLILILISILHDIADMCVFF